MSSSGEWCTIESDPGVFTELLEQVGVPHVELDELWSLDDDSLKLLQETGPVYGLIFLFKWMPESGSGAGSNSSSSRTPLTSDNNNNNNSSLFFAKQTTQNACATQALLSVVLNAENITLGKTLTEFKSFTESFPPDLKGEAIGACEELQTAHNAFCRKDAFLQEGKTHVATGREDVFHFVAYIPFDGIVYELDGLQEGPIVIGDYTTDDWMTVAREAVQERMESSSLGGGDDEIKFNLMAVIRDRRVGLQEKLTTYEHDSLEYQQVLQELQQEESKRRQWKLENERRRHNYVPLCMQLLKELAKTNSLPQLITEANERVRAKQTKSVSK